jgi:hypothetical protein
VAAFSLRIPLLGICLLATTATPANADLSLVFNKAKAVPGETVTALSARRGFSKPRPFTKGAEGVRVYLVPLSLAKRQTHLRATGPPTDARWLPLGRLSRDARGAVRFAFVVPRVEAGDYTIGFWCRPCAPPAGDYFTSARPDERWTGQPYHVVLRIAAVEAPPRRAEPSSSGREDGGSGPDVTLIVSSALALLALAATVAALRYRSVR